MSNYTKVSRDELFATYLDTTPTAQTSIYALLGVGINEYAIAYNPQVDTEKWIVEKNARNDHSSNQKQGSVSQKVYKDDPCYIFIANGRDKLNYVTKILDVDMYNGTEVSSVMTYPAKLSNGLVTITSFGGENAVIEYDLYYNGDPVEGTVTIANGIPTFTPNA